MIYRDTYNGWVYEYNVDTHHFKIKPNGIDIVGPPSLFKHYSLSEFNIDALLHNYLYAAHPNQLNDWYDCCPQMIVYDNPKILRKELKNIGLDLESLSDLELINDFFVQREIRKALWQKEYSKIGLISFTETPSNLLMWSHYSQNKGFCVEYDYTKFPFTYHGPFPINYCQPIQEIHLSETMFPIAVAIQFSVKHKRWEYEKEWRIVAESPVELYMQVFGDHELEKYGGTDRKFYYPISAIKNIGLGVSFFDVEELDFTENYSIATIELSDRRSDTLMRRKMLDWLNFHKINIKVSLPNDLNDIHFFGAKIISEKGKLLLVVTDKLI